MRTILTVGSLNTDLVTTTPRLPGAGETLAASSFETHPGGKGLNQCISAQRASRLSPTCAPASHIAVKMVGCVGTDVFAGPLLETLEQNGLDTGMIKRTADAPTGTAVIIVEEEGGDNRILYCAGANACLRPEDFGDRLFNDKEEEMAALVVIQLETPIETVCRVIELAAAADVKVLVNAAPAAMLPARAWRGITYFVVNETEAAQLAGVEVEALVDGIREAAEGFVKLGARNVIITLGERGAYVFGADVEGEEAWVKAVDVAHVLDTTGAGDAWVGAFAVAVTEGRSVVESMEWASRAAAVAVGRRGALKSVPWRGEVVGNN